jgi:hypothetical protein
MGEWKRTERQVCRMAGAERALDALTGGGCDCTATAPWGIQVKRGYGGPTLRTDWIVGAARDAEAIGKPWLLVQVVPGGRGRKPLMLATCIGATLAELADHSMFPVIVARVAARVELRKRDIASALAPGKPWVIVQDVAASAFGAEVPLSGRAQLATLDYRLLIALARDAGVITNPADGGEGGPPT